MTNAANVVNEIRRAIPEGCVATRCRKHGCSVSLKDAPSPRVLIDLDLPQAPVGQTEKRCDYIFIGASSSAWVAPMEPRVAPMELKRGKPNASEIVPQLQAGADIADRIVPIDAKVQLRPIAVFGGRVAANELRMFAKKSNWVDFRNRTIKIELLRCGKQLVDVLKRAETS